MNTYARILGMSQLPTKLVFYNIADNLQYQKKISTLEFVFRQNLTLGQDLTINEFYSNIIKPLDLKDIEGITVFKALDVNKRQKIRVEDFVIVIDSYRDDNSFYAKKLSEISEKNPEDINNESNRNINNQYGLNDVQLFWINKYLNYLQKIDITERMAFDSAKLDVENKNEQINLDNLKRKLKVLIPKDLISATELNNISDAFDINNNRMLSYDDYIGIIECVKNDPKFAMLFKSNNNEYPLLNYMMNRGTDLKKLPLRTNKDFFKNEAKRLLENKDNNALFQSDDNYIGTNTELPNDIISMNKSQLKKSSLPDFLQNKYKTNKNISEFLKELEVFESGEWSLIELLEDFDIYNNEEFVPSYELYKILENKFAPTIPKETISNCVNEIDSNKDGYISYLDLINFLLNNLRYKSSKIGWKEVTRKIIYGLNMSADDFFNREFKTEKNDNNEISFVQFTKLFTKTFDIAPPVTKQMYDDLQNLIYSHRITKGDLVDTINRQLEYNKNLNEKRKLEKELIDNGLINNEQIKLQSNYMSSLRKDNAKEYNAISLLDKKYYEQEMKNFVKILQKGFIPTGETEMKETFKNNLKSFLNLPDNMKMSQFRELFIKPLCMDYALGISTFQLVKSYNKENNNNSNQAEILSTINTDILFDVLTSFIDFNLSNFEPRLFLFYLENGRFSPLKMCFEAITYNYKGITILDLIREMEIFYPKIEKVFLKSIAKEIDEDEKGIITYKDLSDFIYENSSKENNKFSEDLILKHIASFLDIKHVETEPFLKDIIYKRYSKSNRGNENIITLEMHNNYFISVLKYNTEQSENFFLYLSNIKNKNCYTLDHLVKLVNSIRTEQGKIDEVFLNEDNKQTNLKSKSINKQIIDLLNTLSFNLPLCDAFHNLTVDYSLCISVIELNENLMEHYSHIMDLDRELLKNMYLKMDKNKNGLIYYNDFHKYIKNNNLNNQYKGCYMLHLRYWASKINNEFGGNYTEYLTYKGLIGNKYLSKEAFEICFQVEECLNDSDLCNCVFNYLKEKSGTHENMVYVQNLIDYLKVFSEVSKDNISFKLEEDSVSLKENEYHDIIRETIEKYENNGENFTEIFNKIKMVPDVNNFGKINYKTIREIFVDDYGMNIEQLKAFKDNFCRVPLLFDLLLLCNTCQELSKFKESYKEIINKIKMNIPSEKTFTSFCKNYSISPEKPLGLSEFTEYNKTLFKLSAYECLIIFQKMWTNEDNPNSNDLKVSLKYMVKYLKLNKSFKQEEIIDKDNYISPFLSLALEKLASFIKQNDNPEQIFAKYDKNGDKLLEKNELMELLNDLEIPDLNDDGKVKIINYLDKNNDGDIDYEEFINFLKEYDTNNIIPNKLKSKKRDLPEIKDEEIKDEEEEEEIEEINSQLNINNLKRNYKFNKTQLDGKQVPEFDKILIKLQGKIIEKYPNTIELTLAEESDDNYCLGLDDFGRIISEEINEKISGDNLEKLKEFGERDYEQQEQGIIQCGNFLNNLCDYSFYPEEEISATQAIKGDILFKHKINQILKSKNNEEEKNKSDEENKKKIEDLMQNNKKMQKLKKQFTNAFEKASLKHSSTLRNLANDYKRMYGFNKLMGKVFEQGNNPIFQDYQYKETDFYIRPITNIKVNTILTSEDAALKKCEEIYLNLGKELYVDPEFGGDELCIESIYTNENRFSSGINYTSETVAWRRPKELSSEITFIVDDNSDLNNNDYISKTTSNLRNNNLQKNFDEPTNIIQGDLGDQWFISALSVVLSKKYMLMGEFNPEILDDGVITEEEMKMICFGIYPPIFHTFKKKGIFCFKFYKDMRPLYVIIDDRLPVNRNSNQLIFARCKNYQEFFAPLIEKAYAKLFGSYERLNSGFIEDAIKDLTGLVTQRYVLTENIKSFKNKIWTQLLNYSSDYIGAKFKLNAEKSKIESSYPTGKNNFLLYSIIEDPNNKGKNEINHKGKKIGLFTNIGYTIIKAFAVENEKENNKSDEIKLNNSMMNINDKLKSTSTLKTKPKVNTENRFLLMCTNCGGNLKNYKIQNEYLKLINSYHESRKIYNEFISNSKRKNSNYFIIAYEDFLNIFTKLYLNYHFPSSDTTFYYEDLWSRASDTCGGIPIYSTDDNDKNWGKNPQYYLKLDEKSSVYLNLKQPDPRYSNSIFPYKHVVVGSCIMVLKIKMKGPISNYKEVDEKIYISPIRQHKDNPVLMALEKGEYIISCCCRETDILEEDIKNFKLICSLSVNESKFVFEKINGVNQERHIIISEEKRNKKAYNDKKAQLIYSQMKNLLISQEIEKKIEKDSSRIKKLQEKLEEEQEEEDNKKRKKKN